MVDRQERAEVLVSITGWADRDADPPLASVEMVDAVGDVWSFVDAVTSFRPDLPDDPAFPMPGRLACLIVRDEMLDGVLLVHIDTGERASLDGVSRFRVLRAMVP